MNDYPHKDASAAQKTASQVQKYLEDCASRERWPDSSELDSIIANHFAPVMRGTPQPLDGTLLSAFQRFADLSMYWHRRDTPDDLALSELNERIRLAVDIPEMIRRLTAFADLGAGQMADRYMAARKLQPETGADAGQFWRNLIQGETVQAGDECWHSCDRWEPCDFTIGTKCDERQARLFLYRRRVTKAPQDTAEHIRADYQPKAPETAIAAQEQPSKEVWRMLEDGEVIQAGDQIQYEDGNWGDAGTTIGTKMGASDIPFRRRVSPSPEPKLP